MNKYLCLWVLALAGCASTPVNSTAIMSPAEAKFIAYLKECEAKSPDKFLAIFVPSPPWVSTPSGPIAQLGASIEVPGTEGPNDPRVKERLAFIPMRFPEWEKELETERIVGMMRPFALRHNQNLLMSRGK